MLMHYLELALRSLRHHRGLTALMVLAIAMGVCACTATLTIFLVRSGDPLPGRSALIHRVQLDAQSQREYVPGAEPDDQLARSDAENLLRDARGTRQAMMAGGVAALASGGGDAPKRQPEFVGVRYTSADFFAMFGVPFVQGQGWTAADDQARGRVAVLSRARAEKLFDRTDVVGRSVRLNDIEFRVVGVLGEWEPIPHFYDLNVGSFRGAEGVYLPLHTALDAKLGFNGSLWCWGQDNVADVRGLGVPCSWLQYWVQLDTPAQVQAYREYLVQYSAQQKAAGRFERPPNVRLRPVMDFLAHKKVVPPDVRLQVWLAAGFLLVCLVNTVGLLLAKFMRRAGEVGVRRALGASRRAIFAQFLVEAALVGALGSVLGVGLAQAGLWLARQDPTNAGRLVALDGLMLAAIVGAALIATLLAGLLPAWRACQVTPALQLKSQ